MSKFSAFLFLLMLAPFGAHAFYVAKPRYGNVLLAITTAYMALVHFDVPDQFPLTFAAIKVGYSLWLVIMLLVDGYRIFFRDFCSTAEVVDVFR